MSKSLYQGNLSKAEKKGLDFERNEKHEERKALKLSQINRRANRTSRRVEWSSVDSEA